MKLDEAIVTNFDAAERAVLAAGLGVSWDALPGDAPAARAAALVEALGRDGRAADLLAALALARPAVAWAELPWPADTLRRLHAALCRRHSLESLRTLCFRLGLDFDDLPGETKSARARELVLAMDRQGRMGELWVASGKWQGAGGRRAGKSNPRPVAGSHWAGDRGRLVGRHLGLIVRDRWRVTSGSYLLPLFIALAVALLSAADGRRGGIGANPSSPIFQSPNHALSPFLSPPASGGAQAKGTATAERRSPIASSPQPSISPFPSLPVGAETQGNSGIGVNSQSPITPSPTSSLSPSSVHATVLVGERGANLRRGPGPEFPVVATLRAGARLELRAVSPTGEWYQVRYPGHGTPWIDAAYAVVVGGVGGLPVATAGPEPTLVHRPSSAELTPTRRPSAVSTATATPPPTPSPIPTAAVPTAAVPTATVPPP